MSPVKRLESSEPIFTVFNENDPLHQSTIIEFGKMMDSKFPGGFHDDYCYNRRKIGKREYRKQDGTYHGVKVQNDKGGYDVRMPISYLEDESKWLAWKRMKESGYKYQSVGLNLSPKADLPF